MFGVWGLGGCNLGLHSAGAASGWIQAGSMRGVRKYACWGLGFGLWVSVFGSGVGFRVEGLLCAV